MTYGTYSSGRIHAGDLDFRIVPRRPNGRLVVYCSSHSGAAITALMPVSAPGRQRIVYAIAKAGYTVIGSDMGGAATYGNTLVQTRLAEVVAAGQAIEGVSDDPPFALGVSMGALTALNYTRGHTVAGVVGILPLIDPQELRVNNPGGYDYRTELDAAHGVAYPAALPAGVNPNVDRAVYEDIPIGLWYAQSDDVALASTTVAFGTAVGADLHSLVGGHDETPINSIDPQDIVDWLDEIREAA